MIVENDLVTASVKEAIAAIEFLQKDESICFINQVADLLADVFASGGKLLVAGNGGSLCDSSHFAEELTGQFRGPRRALPAISLCNPGHLTCVANDMGFDEVFARGIEAHGQKGDVFCGLTTSGNSANLIKAFKKAHAQGLKTVAFLGKGGGALKGVADFELIVDGFAYSDRIQEAHMAAIHIIIEKIESLLFGTDSTVTRSFK